MEEQSIIKEKLQLELSFLAKDMENYYHNLLKENEFIHQPGDFLFTPIKNTLLLNEEILKDRLKNALYLSALFLSLKLKNYEKMSENLEFEALWKILEHPLLKEPFLQEKITELNLLKERIFFLKMWNKDFANKNSL